MHARLRVPFRQQGSRHRSYAMSRAAPIAVPASWAAPRTNSDRNGPSRSSRALETQLSATPPAKHRLRSPVARKAFAPAQALPPPFAVAAPRRRRQIGRAPADHPASASVRRATRARGRRSLRSRASAASTRNGGSSLPIDPPSLIRTGNSRSNSGANRRWSP